VRRRLFGPICTLDNRRPSEHALTVSQARVRKVLKLVDELELDPAELRALRAELDARGECEIDLDACENEDERQLALTIKRRIDAAARGETTIVSMADASRILRERRKARGRRPSAG
jgi:hypothetical protein